MAVPMMGNYVSAEKAVLEDRESDMERDTLSVASVNRQGMRRLYNSFEMCVGGGAGALHRAPQAPLSKVSSVFYKSILLLTLILKTFFLACESIAEPSYDPWKLLSV